MSENGDIYTASKNFTQWRQWQISPLSSLDQINVIMNIYINSINIYLLGRSSNERSSNNKAWNIFNQSMFHQLTIIFISLIFRSPPFWSSLWLFLGLVTSSESSIIYTRWGLSFPLVTFLSFAYFQNYLTDLVQQMCKC